MYYVKVFYARYFPVFCSRKGTCSTRLFKSFEFENGSKMSDEKLVTLEFKYLENKEW